MPDKTILIVEDEAHLRILVERALSSLTKRDIHFLCAANGQEGLDLIRSSRPHVVLLDVMMPKMNGFEVCRAVKDDPELADTKIILLTTLGQTDDYDKGKLAGADDFITKPFDPSDLLDRVSAYV